MNGKRFVDIMACSLSAAIAIAGYLYLKEDTVKQFVSVVCGVLFLVFLVLAVIDESKEGRVRGKNRRGRRGKRSIHVLALLDENNQVISEWNIAGKISVLIGRDTHKENVDVNLMNTAFAGMVDKQHAVMNYTAGQWYIEDLESTNGIRVQKRKDNKIYQVAKTQPCLIEKGDILFIGLTKLAAI